MILSRFVIVFIIFALEELTLSSYCGWEAEHFELYRQNDSH